MKNYVKPRTNSLNANINSAILAGSDVIISEGDGAPTMGSDAKRHWKDF